MKNEELLKTLIDELFKLDSIHEEYQDGEIHFRIDSEKNRNTLNIKVEKLENTDKKEFEKWLENIDDDVFTEMVESLPKNFNTIYNSPNYKDIIDIATISIKNILNDRINKYKMILGE